MARIVWLRTACVTNDTAQLGEEEISATNTFKYIDPIFAAEEGTEGDCKNSGRLSWSKWRETTGAICDKKVLVNLKDTIYRTVINPDLTSYTKPNAGP